MDGNIERLKSLLVELRQVINQRYTNDRNFISQVASFWPNFQRKVQAMPRQDITIYYEDIAVEASQDINQLKVIENQWMALNITCKEQTQRLTDQIVRLREELGWSEEQYNAWFSQVFPKRRQPESWEWEVLRVPS